MAEDPSAHATSATGRRATIEWTVGFGNRFGLVYVDFETQRRIPKLSAECFREAASRNSVV